MNLVFDIGNTKVKYAIFDHDKIVEQYEIPVHQFNSVEIAMHSGYKIKHIIFSSVRNTPYEPLITEKKDVYIDLNYTTLLPIKNKYKTPETLGNDRLANAVGATIVFPQKNVLIIDMGTCIKYDFIDSKKNYHGGAISPGFNMRFKSLNKYTDRLPLIKPSKKFPLTGKSTQQSILSGVQNGIIFEINGMIEQYKKKYNELKVIITGGNHTFFANHLKSSIFAAPDLTLQGLNEILNYNVLKKS